VLALTIDLQNLLFEVFDGLLAARIEGAVAAGTYDLGLETITAEGLAVVERRTFYTHPGTGAETQVLTVARRDRNSPLGLDEALERGTEPRARLLVNGKSGHAAVQVPAPSVTLDDGEVERRIRLLRPMERRAMPLDALTGSHWEEVDEATFSAAWQAEIDRLPEFVDSTFHVVTGLLLPIWRRLPDDGCRVYRLQADDGERVIGRLVSPAWVADALGAEAPAVAPGDAWTAVLAKGAMLQLADGLTVRRSAVMHVNRVELTGFTDGMVDRLKAMGLVSEIISWRLRLFVPTGAQGPAILGVLLDRHPLSWVIAKPFNVAVAA